jgi:phage terminase large subunit
MTASALEHDYEPAGSALGLLYCHQPEVLLSGAAGTGKSRACLEKVHAMCMRYPGMRALVVRKTATSLTSTALVTYRQIVAAEALASGEVAFYGGSGQEAASFRYMNGSTITVGGMDKSSRIMSSEYDVAYVQEATELTEDDWESISTRLRNGKTPYQQLMADCNPGPPHHWLKRRADAGRCTMLLSRHEDNPRYYRDGQWSPEGRVYLERLDALTGVRRERLRYGRWAAAEGLVYDTFDPHVHLSTRFNRDSRPPLDWPRYLAVDFGFTNPSVFQWWTADPDGRLYMYREIYMTKRLVEDHARQIAKLQHQKAGLEPDFTSVICDHDAEDRATLERHLGVSTIAAHKDVLPGIEAVKARMKPAGDGKPRIFICRDALVERDPALDEARKPMCTEQELSEYVWDSRPQPGSQNTREAPVKQNDHGADAMRYLVAHCDLQGRPRVRWFLWAEPCRQRQKPRSAPPRWGTR